METKFGEIRDISTKLLILGLIFFILHTYGKNSATDIAKSEINRLMEGSFVFSLCLVWSFQTAKTITEIFL